MWYTFISLFSDQSLIKLSWVTVHSHRKCVKTCCQVHVRFLTNHLDHNPKSPSLFFQELVISMLYLSLFDSLMTARVARTTFMIKWRSGRNRNSLERYLKTLSAQEREASWGSQNKKKTIDSLTRGLVFRSIWHFRFSLKQA